jgi:predicted outer membrane repeat protein
MRNAPMGFLLPIAFCVVRKGPGNAMLIRLLLRGIAGAVLVCAYTSLHAATFPVGSADVAGLKAAINAANTNNQDDTIVLTASTYTLTARDSFAPNAAGPIGLPGVAADGGHTLTILGNGSTITRSSAQSFRFFYVGDGANLTISGLTLTNGTPGALHGGAIYNDGAFVSASLAVIGCTISGNSADYGGAIWNDGSQQGMGPSTATLTVRNSTFSNNFASQHGGAIWNESGSIVMNVTNSTFDTNSTNGSAGAIQFDAFSGVATGSISGCTFTNNFGNANNNNDHYGGAVNIDGASGNANLTITNCTFDQNSAKFGGAVSADGSGGLATVVLSSCTFNMNSANSAGGGIYLSTTTSGTTSLQLGNSILESDGAAANIVTQGISGGVPVFTSQGYNLSDDAAGGGLGTAPAGFLNHTGDIRNTDASLDPAGLKDNGGPTLTIALQATSPALDHGKSNTISSTNNDQRGEFRPFDDPNTANASGGDGSDIGAYEATVRAVSESRSGSPPTTLNFSFQSILGHTYEMQSRPSLGSGMWSSVNTSNPPPPISGTGGIITVTVPNAIGSGSGFYRANQLP